MEVKEKRIWYFDVLRICATLAVIILHCAASKWNSVDLYSNKWLALNFWDSIVRWGVPIFVMISGALFLNPNKKIETKKIFKVNLLRIITAFCFWSVIYSFYSIYAAGKTFTIAHFINVFVKGEYHLWFLFMIAGLYIIIPLVRKITEDKKTTKYFLVLALIFSFIIPTIREVSNTLIPIFDNDSITKAVTSLFAAYDKIHFSFTLEYVSYFVLGYYLSQIDIKKRNRIIIYILSLLGFAFTIIFSKEISFITAEKYNIYDPMTLNVLLESLGIFVFVKQIVAKLNIEKFQKPIKFISDKCFGIYLIHALLLKILDNSFGINSLMFNGYISVPILSLIVFAISLLLSILISKIPFLNKYIS